MEDPQKQENIDISETDEHDMPALQEELKKYKADVADYLSGWQRAKADYINYKNEEARRLEDTARFVTGSVMQDMLPVLDSFDLALKSYLPSTGSPPERSKQTRRDEEHGILLIRSQLLDVLKKRGLEQMRVSPGDDFNPERHETLVEVESDLPPGSVVEEIQKGYILRERTIRPARVSIAKEK